jgi:hypothetical protein
MKHTLRVPVTAAMLVAVHLVFLSGAIVFGAESIVTNGNFQKWTDGVPDGWKVEIGATNGAKEPKSEVKPIKGPALMLRGDAATMAWHAVSQQISVRPGGSYCLEFESRTRDIRREGRQHDNCYVGVISLDSTGKPVERKHDDVAADRADWTKHRLVFTVGQGVESTRVMIFLSKSGILGVKNVAVTAADDTAASSVEPTTVAGSKPAALLTNGDFSDWKDGRPDGWKVGIGARNGADQPTSQIIRLSDPGLALRGKASTMAWYSLSQEVPVREGHTYTLELEALSDGIQKQGRQFNNCYVGVISFDAAGKKAGMTIEDFSRVPRWKKFRIDFTVPNNATKTEVMIFLSKTGTLSVKNLSVKEATPHRSFRGSNR